MSELEELLRDVNILREKLEFLIKEKQENLIDSEVIAASKILNAALNQYNKFIADKVRK